MAAVEMLETLEDLSFGTRLDHAMVEWAARNRVASAPWSPGIDKSLRSPGPVPTAVEQTARTAGTVAPQFPGVL